jgi:hypothetical protein
MKSRRCSAESTFGEEYGVVWIKVPALWTNPTSIAPGRREFPDA